MKISALRILVLTIPLSLASTGAQAVECYLCAAVPETARWAASAKDLRQANTIGDALRAAGLDVASITHRDAPSARRSSADPDKSIAATTAHPSTPLGEPTAALAMNETAVLNVIASLDARLKNIEAWRASTIGSPGSITDRLLVREETRMPDDRTSVNHDDLKRVALALADALDNARAQLTPMAEPCSNEAPTEPTVLGDGILGDLDGGPTLYDTPARLIIDLGGCDEYYGPHASANGLDSNPIGVVLDLGGGNDVYINEVNTYSQGGANSGIAALVDDGGDDRYQAVAFGTQGVGIVGGVGLFADLGGNDVRIAQGSGGGFGAQGLGTLGLGASVDLGAGNDVYSYEFDPGETPAGFSRLLGAQGTGLVGVGLLADGGGADIYSAQATGTAVSLNAQGVGNFIAEGTLIDAGGDDIYETIYETIELEKTIGGSVLGQGAASLNGVGVHIDAAGNDSRTVSAYVEAKAGYAEALGQGWAFGVVQWAGSATMIDLAGNDDNLIKANVVAPDGVAVSEGQASSIFDTEGQFADLQGDDTYRLRADGPSRYVVGQGVGRGGGTGIFIDGLGDDTYEADGIAQGFGGRFDFGQGLVIPGGQGLFADGGGSNSIEGPGDRGAFWTNSEEGVGLGVNIGAGVDEANALVDLVLGLFGIPRP